MILPVSILNQSQIATLPVDAAKLTKATEVDPLLSKVLLYIQEGWPTQCSEISSELQPCYQWRLEITVEAGCGVCMLLLYLFHAKNFSRHPHQPFWHCTYEVPSPYSYIHSGH